MFRALAYFDSDFSRHIEGADLRLRWDEGSLFHFTAEQIRVALNLDVENDARVWGRFAQRGLEGRVGFEQYSTTPDRRQLPRLLAALTMKSSPCDGLLAVG